MEELSRLWCVRKTVNALLLARNYIVPQKELDKTLEEFKVEFGDFTREKLTILAAKKDDPTDQIFVFFCDDTRVGCKHIQIYTDRMEKQKIKRAILVMAGAMTPFGKRAIDTLYEQDRVILEYFMESELMVNITQHSLVPEHTLMSDAEKKALLKRYHLKENQLPRIQLIDPISRFYGLEKGQVVKIIRSSETAGRYVTYRIVV